MDISIINISVGFPDEPLATFDINKLMNVLTDNLEKTEELIGQLKLVQFKNTPDCRDEFPDCKGILK